MNTNQESASRDDGAPAAVQDSGSVLLPARNQADTAERVIAAYAAAAQGGAGPRESAFDVAVRAYIACYPGTCWDVAARIVADVISHRS